MPGILLTLSFSLVDLYLVNRKVLLMDFWRFVPKVGFGSRRGYNRSRMLDISETKPGFSSSTPSGDFVGTVVYLDA